MTKGSDIVEIFKLLPGGRRVTRQVTADEYVNGGWFNQGWATQSNLQIAAGNKVADQRLRNLYANTPITQLKEWARPFKIAKKLPNEKWVSRTVYGGEYEHEGWMNNGWIIPKWNYVDWRHSYKGPKDTPKAAQYYMDKIQSTQNWWRPKLTLDQARMMLEPHHKLIHNELGHDINEEARQVTQHWKPNIGPWRDWMDKAQKWMYKNRQKKYNYAMRQKALVDRRRYLIPLFQQYNKIHPAPPRVIPRYPKVPFFGKMRHHTRYALNYH